MENEIKVFIVDDHDMVRLGIRTYLLLEPGIQVIGEASNGKKAIEQLESGLQDGLPDVILMDLIMPEMNGVEATREVIQKYPQIKIIILTSFLEDEKVINAVEAGATNYVLKTVSSQQLVSLIQRACQELPAMSTEVSQALTRGLRQRASSQTDHENFTSREKEVLLLIAEGKANKEIAQELHISVKTVKTHVSNLLMKCTLEDRTQLAIYAHRKGWAGTGKTQYT